MPISYRIDPDRQLILTRAWGVLTDADILGHKSSLLADPAFDPGLPQLSDIRDIERLDVTPVGVRAMIAHDQAHAAERRGHRMALVVPMDKAFGMARMYELLGDRPDRSVGVFREMAEAEAWLVSDGS